MPVVPIVSSTPPRAARGFALAPAPEMAAGTAARRVGLWLLRALLCVPLCVLSACGGHSGGQAFDPDHGRRPDRVAGYRIGGTVTGLRGALKLLNNQEDPLELRAPGPFVFGRRVAEGEGFDVEVATHPPAQTCRVSFGSGLPGGDFLGVRVRCGRAGLRTVHSLGDAADAADWLSPFVQAGDGSMMAVSAHGGPWRQGAVLRVAADGSESVVHAFDDQAGDRVPYAMTLARDGNLYGVTSSGGLYGQGSVFRVRRQGSNWAWRSLHSFGADPHAGTEPSSPLLLGRDGALYGTTASGGPGGGGTVYRITTDGALRVLHRFVDPQAALAMENGSSVSTADLDDGGDALSRPRGALVEDDAGMLYGTATEGGGGGRGGVFCCDPRLRLSWSAASMPAAWPAPQHGLLRARDGVLYGVAQSSEHPGVLYSLGSDGVLRERHRFGAEAPAPADPRGVPVEGSDGRLYATSFSGGAHGAGTLYAFDPGDDTIEVLHAFGDARLRDGARPRSGLALAADGRLWGGTSTGGAFDGGTVFRLDSSVEPPA